MPLPIFFPLDAGSGKSHGEGIEQNWAFSNGAAGSTRLMGPGSRHATLEDIFGFHNYDRLLAMHRVLPKRLALAIKEGTAHAAAFDAFTKGLKKATQHTTPEGSPFELKDEVTTLRDIQLQIATEEFVCTGDGIEVERDHSPGTFITMGLDIEEAQRKLTVDVSAIKDPSATQKLDFTRRRTALLRRIHKFREIQRVYMPSVRGALSVSQKQMFDGNGEQLPEATRLFMPSELPDAPIRTRVCALGLPEIEARMREAESTEALEAVRTGLRTRTMTNRYKLRNYTGQGLMTKGQGILRQINRRYWFCGGHGAWEGRLRVLADDDVWGLNERALTDEEKAQNEHWAEIGGAIIEGGVACGGGWRRGRAITRSRGYGTRSAWWRGENDIRLEDALRVEWCKALARSHWERLAGESLAGASEELTEGRCAYAAEHALTERARCADLEKRWRPILDRADAYLAGNTDIAAVTVEVDVTDELDPEEEEARLEGDAGEDDGA
ncbi:CxC2 domain-containing protein [Mycena sanguinolenta]|uniref:CxC2 domain-containing protein n=1 Tax=Mycena sanguinolenta TaxID=230812 RepID=A0A8H7CCQ9_9AGAR|nr:CxC2 domain-containing protein [Mycena sanguinolenta]